MAMDETLQPMTEREYLCLNAERSVRWINNPSHLGFSTGVLLNETIRHLESLIPLYPNDLVLTDHLILAIKNLRVIKEETL
jgi:hypothetical protein